MCRLRIVYSKGEELKYLSPLELSKAMQRLIRRSNLCFMLKGKFHPLMKISFPPPLPTGVCGENEVFDIVLHTSNNLQDMYEKLNNNFPQGFKLKEIFYSDNLPSLGKISKIQYLFKGKVLNKSLENLSYNNLILSKTSEGAVVEIFKESNFIKFNVLMEIVKQYIYPLNFITRLGMFYLINNEYIEVYKNAD